MKQPQVSPELPWEELKSNWTHEKSSHLEVSWTATTADRGLFVQMRLDRWRLGASSEEMVRQCACAVGVRAFSQRADLSLRAWTQRRSVSLTVTLTEARLEFCHERWFAEPAAHFRRCGAASAASCTVDVHVVDVGVGPDSLCGGRELLPIQ